MRRAVRGRPICAASSRFALRSPLSTRFLVAALSQPATLMQTLSTDDHVGGRRLRAAVRDAWIGGCVGRRLLRRSAGIAPDGLRRRTGRVPDCRSARRSPSAPNLPIWLRAGRSPIFRAAPRPLIRPRVRSSIWRWQSAGCQFHGGLCGEWSDLPTAELRRAEWCRFSASDFPAPGRRPLWIWMERRCACCSRHRHSRSMRKFR